MALASDTIQLELMGCEKQAMFNACGKTGKGRVRWIHANYRLGLWWAET